MNLTRFRIGTSIIAALVALAVALAAWAAVLYRADSRAPLDHLPIVYVVIDEASMSEFGRPPIDRNIYAGLIRRAQQAGARSVALKFFFDQAAPSDAALALAMRGLPVFLQASIKDMNGVSAQTGVAGSGRTETLRVPDQWRRSGGLLGAPAAQWPVAALAGQAYGIGMVDARIAANHDRIESAILVGDRAFASLQLKVAESALQSSAIMTPHSLGLGGHQFKLDEMGRIVCPYLDVGMVRAWPARELLAGRVPVEALQGKAVIIGYAGKDAPMLHVSALRELDVHEYFVRQVICLLRGDPRDHQAN